MSEMNAIPDTEIFNKDPKEITDKEFEQLLTRLRRERAALVEADAKGKPAPRKKAAPKANLNLDDLGL